MHLLLNLLKWQFQPGLRGASREASIRVQRIELVDRLADNPSLRPAMAEAIASAYRVGRIEAAAETGLISGAFPGLCPWSAA